MRSSALQMTNVTTHLGRVHDLLAYVYLPKPLEYSQEGNVEPLPGDLLIPGGMIPAVANV